MPPSWAVACAGSSGPPRRTRLGQGPVKGTEIRIAINLLWLGFRGDSLHESSVGQSPAVDGVP